MPGKLISAILRIAGVGVATLFIGLVFSIGMLSVAKISAPSWIRESAEDRLAALSGDQSTELGKIEFFIDIKTLSPAIHVSRATILDPKLELELELSELTIFLDPLSALSGNLSMRSIFAENANLSAVMAGVGADIPETRRGLSVLAQLPGLANLNRTGDPVLAALESVRIGSVDVLLRVSDTNQTVRMTGGQIEVTKSEQGLDAFGRTAWQVSETNDAEVTAALRLSSQDAGFGLDLTLAGAVAKDFSAFVDLPIPSQASNAPVKAQLHLAADATGSLSTVTGQFEIGRWQAHLPAAVDPIVVHKTEIAAEYEIDTGRIHLNSIAIDSSAGMAGAVGHFDIAMDSDGQKTAEGRIEIAASEMAPSEYFDSGISNILGEAELRFRMDGTQFDVARLALSVEDTEFEAHGGAHLTNSGWAAGMEFGLDSVTRNALLSLWPAKYASEARDWINDRVDTGTIFAVNGGLRLKPKAEPIFNANFQFEGIGLEFIEGFPPLTDGKGFGALEGSWLGFRFDSGRVADASGNSADIAGSELSIPNIFDDNAHAQLTLLATSKVSQLLTLVEKPPLQLLTASKIPNDAVAGDFVGSGSFDIPLEVEQSFDNITFQLNGEIQSAVTQDLLGNGRFESESLHVKAEETGITVSGAGSFRGIPVDGSWKHEFRQTGVGDNLLTGTVELSPEFFETFGVHLPAGTIRGRQRGDFYVTFPEQGAPEFGISTEARGLAFSLPAVSVEKPVGEPAEVVLEGRLASPIELRRVTLAGKGFAVEGAVSFGEDGGYEVAEFSSAEFGDWLTASVVIQNDAEFGAIVTGGSADLQKAYAAGGGRGWYGKNRKPVSVQLDTVVLSSSIALSDLNGTLTFRDDIAGEFVAKLNGRADVMVSLVIREEGSALRLRSQNAGEMLRAAGIIGNLHEGALEMVIVPPKSGEQANIVVRMSDVYARNMPTLGELLSIASIFGLVEQLNGEGILFSDVSANLMVDHDRIVFQDSYATGPSLGITVQGTVDRVNDRLDLDGVITPFNTANELLLLTPLKLFGFSKGEGPGAIAYYIKGPVDGPETGANPLTILTPGILKNLFKLPRSDQ